MTTIDRPLVSASYMAASWARLTCDCGRTRTQLGVTALHSKEKGVNGCNDVSKLHIFREDLLFLPVVAAESSTWTITLSKGQCHPWNGRLVEALQSYAISVTRARRV